MLPRRKLLLRALVVLSAGGCLFAQTQYFNFPLIYGRGMVNAASFMPAGLAGGSIARGSIFTIFGTLFGPSTGVKATSYPLGTTLAGVSVKVTQGNTSVDAIPIYVSSTQINAIMPSNAPLGRASVQITYNQTADKYLKPTTNNAPVNIVPSSFGIFSVNSAGFGPGIFTDASYNYVTLASPVKPGQAVIIWGTGLGPITGGDNQAPTAGNLATQTEVFVGGQSAALAYNGRAPCCSGLDQIVFTVPANAPTGCWVPVQVRTGGTVVSNSATLAISADGSVCSDPFNPLAAPYVAGKATGLIHLHRVDAKLDELVDTPSEPIVDFGFASMLKPASGAFFFNSLISIPPPGSCTTYNVAGDTTNTTAMPGVTGGGALLDAGTPFTIAGVAAQRLSDAAFYDQLLGANDSTISAHGPVFQPPASVAVSGPGGADVGGFQASVPTGAGIRWTNRDSFSVVDHTQPLTVTWDAASAAGSTVIVSGSNVDTPHNASAMFMCAASASAGSLTVPAATLANVPPTSQREVQPKGVLVVSAVPLSGAAPFNASGIASGAALYSSWFAKSVAWK